MIPLPFGIPWKYVIIGLVTLAVVVGVRSAVASYNAAIAEVEVQRKLKEQEQAEKEKAIRVAENNAKAIEVMRDEMLRMQSILSANRVEREEIEETLNGELSAWKRRAVALAEAGDKCVNVPHPEHLFDNGVQPRENNEGGSRETSGKIMPAKYSDGTRICTGLYGACLVRLGNVLKTPASHNPETERGQSSY